MEINEINSHIDRLFILDNDKKNEFLFKILELPEEKQNDIILLLDDFYLKQEKFLKRAIECDWNWKNREHLIDLRVVEMKTIKKQIFEEEILNDSEKIIDDFFNI